MVEGIVIGLIGAAIPLGILYALYGKIVMYISDKFSFISNMMKFLSVNEIFHKSDPGGIDSGCGNRFYRKPHHNSQAFEGIMIRCHTGNT